jgi:hypothetical protein
MNEALNNRASECALCPRCGKPGRTVSEVTVQSLVTDQAKTRFKQLHGFSFCPTAGCAVVYFRAGSGECVFQQEVRVDVFQKSTNPKRLVCYCFGHTLEAVQADARANSASRTLEEIKANCAQGLDRCEETNPQGSCCLGNVQRVIRETVDKNGLPPSGSSCGCCRG